MREQLTRTVARAACGLPAAVQHRLTGGPVVVDGQELHPEIAMALKLIGLAEGEPFETLPVEVGRARLVEEAAVFSGPPTPVESVQDFTFPGPESDIPVRFYKPVKATGPLPLLVYFHGGGWVFGDLDSHDSTCRFLCAQAEVAVLAVDYRLAPEHPFPAAPDDALAAFHYAVKNAEELGIDPLRIAVGGDSAGGNLAAVTAQSACAAGGARPAFQMLFVPVTDLSYKRRSYTLFSEGWFLTEAHMDWYKARYLADPEQAHDPRVSPILASDLSGLPPAYIANAGFDPLRDEGVAYAQRLREAGVPVSHRLHSGLIHPFVNTLGVGVTGRATLLEAAGALRVGLSV
jgi:acetyl esterase